MLIQTAHKESGNPLTDSTCNPRQRLCDRENEREGKLTGYDCSECRNKGYVVFLKGDEIVQRECSCMKTRRSLKRIERSGLGKSIERLTFDTYIATEEWQKKAKALAERYSREGEGAWFFIGGQSGSGKTHLCTAISGKLLNDGKALKYMLWRDEATRIKALINDYDEYDRLTNELKEAEVLYIDDFLKTQRGTMPSPADINLAFEILNYRYINSLMTIISSERGIYEIIDIDEAVGGRIHTMARDFFACISNDKAKNYRMR
jgi:DNA replication protein DnaC